MCEVCICMKMLRMVLYLVFYKGEHMSVGAHNFGVGASRISAYFARKNVLIFALFMSVRVLKCRICRKVT